MGKEALIWEWRVEQEGAMSSVLVDVPEAAVFPGLIRGDEPRPF